MPRLVVFRERVLHRSIDLGQRELTIGRGEQNDVVLDDPDKVVSRFHAELRPQNGGLGMRGAASYRFVRVVLRG